MDEQVREVHVVSLLAVTSTFFNCQRMDRVDEILDNVLSILCKEGPKNWLKLSHLLYFIRDFGNDFQRQEYLVQKGTVGKLIDFALGKRSPLCKPTEKRPEMGGQYAKPNFEPLVVIVCYLSRLQMNFTFFVNKHDGVFISEPEGYPTPYFHHQQPNSLVLPEVDQRLVLDTNFILYMLEQMVDTKNIACLAGHICSNNYKLSKYFIKKLLIEINGGSSNLMYGYSECFKVLMLIDDKYQMQRNEWFMGLPQMNISYSNNYMMDKLTKIGIHKFNSINDDIYKWESRIYKNQTSVKECMLHMFWSYRNRFSTTMFIGMKYYFEVLLATENDELLSFYFNQPPPTYQMACYHDWVRPFLNEQIAHELKYGTQSTKQDIELYTSVIDLID